MPIISQFYGIYVYMFNELGSKHSLEHIHIKYNEYKAVYDLKGNLIEGKLPIKQRKLVEAWIIIHKIELKQLWECIENQNGFYKIEPLK